MRIEPLSRPAVEYVVSNMRAWDRSEIFATRWSDDEVPMVDQVMAMGDVSWVAYGEGDTPIAVFGCAPLWPGVWSMWFFATDNIHQIGISVTKMIVRHIIPMLWDGGAHRLQCHSMEGHVDAQNWLETIGASREGTARGYGRSGQDFHCYVWEKP